MALLRPEGIEALTPAPELGSEKSECGLDLTHLPSEKHFVSWLDLSPQNKISANKVLSSRKAA